MNLVAYLTDEIAFLTEERDQAKQDHNQSMAFLCESRLDEANRILEQIRAGKITSLTD